MRCSYKKARSCVRAKKLNRHTGFNNARPSKEEISLKKHKKDCACFEAVGAVSTKAINATHTFRWRGASYWFDVKYSYKVSARVWFSARDLIYNLHLFSIDKSMMCDIFNIQFIPQYVCLSEHAVVELGRTWYATFLWMKMGWLRFVFIKLTSSWILIVNCFAVE